MSDQFSPRVVPFIPDLEGAYNQRFYSLVASWRHGDNQDIHVETIEKEISDLEKSSSPDSEQYRRYRAVLFLLRDLLTTTWEANFEYGQLVLNTFTASDISATGTQGSSNELIQSAKAKLQRCMESSRLRVIEENREFITRVEQGTWTKQCKPISSLISDGKDLADKLRSVIAGDIKLRDVINPEIQLVDDSTDSTTGLRLLDIWRYFRYTWSSPAENTPGRSMQYLIRNKALPGHPVMGISSLDNCALAMGPRDEFIGWSAGSFEHKLSEDFGYPIAKIIKQVDAYLSEGIASICIKDFELSQEELEHPTKELILELRTSAHDEKTKRRISLAEDLFKADSEESKKLLFAKKRKDKLASFLDARRQINEFIENKGGIKNISLNDLQEIHPAMTIALQAQKEKHIGSSMLELNVCGAIKPYNELLAGKLVALCALTPYVIDTYRERYKGRPSEIASQMLGKDVCRPSDLVYVGTTSLYRVGSSQYNRLVAPGVKIGSSFDLKFIELDEKTQGFGTFHISRKTIDAIEQVLDKDGSQMVNHQFGEGASPKLRLLGEGIRALLKSDGNSDITFFTRHAMPRIIFAAPLISNYSKYLLGIEKRPRYYESRKDGADGTQRIIDFWMERWLTKRLDFTPALERVAMFDLNDDANRRLVGRFLQNESGSKDYCMEATKELISVEESATTPSRVQFLRKFYRNGSAYADSTNLDILKSIHVKTNLDDAIIETIKRGKDCVLTGNPGDGKTHVIRVLEGKIKEVNRKIEPIYDASTLTTDEIAEKWFDAKKKRVPFVIAINASVLYELNQSQSRNLPKAVHEAYLQFESGVVSDPAPHDFSMHGVTVFNLGLRSALDPTVVSGVIDQMTRKDNFRDCKKCPLKGRCGFRRHASIIRSERFKERMQKIFHRVDLVGWHVTVRDVQAFFSFLLFWNHKCENVANESERDEYRIENLIYNEGRGNLFDAVRAVFDPSQISMPELDERLVVGDFSMEDWLPDAAEPNSAIDMSSQKEFNRRKRAFYFFHKDGDRLLENRTRNSVASFEQFLELPEKKQLKEILTHLRSFIGDKGTTDTSDTFPVWRGFRFDNSPRRMIISIGSVPRSRFSIVKPRLLSSMEQAFSSPINYVLLKESLSGRCLKIDFAMFKLLEYADQKVPVWALEENNNSKKIWRFMDDLTPQTEDDDEHKVVLYDLKRNEKIAVDIEEHRYVNISEKEGVK